METGDSETGGGEAAWTREEEHRQGTEVPGCAAGQVVASHRAQAQARLYSCEPHLHGAADGTSQGDHFKKTTCVS